MFGENYGSSKVVIQIYILFDNSLKEFEFEIAVLIPH
jgi:hypothetical protein